MRANLIAALMGMLCVVGCGGGGSSSNITPGGGGGGGTPSGPNVQSVTVDSGPSVVANSKSPAVNILYTTVTVCAPGSSTCQTIDHVQVDTGSSGLRILASVLTISLPLDTDSSGNAIAECAQFVDGSSWGPLRKADIKIASETASNLPVHVIGDAAYPTVPSACTGTPENTVTQFGANGILGVGSFLQDCGGACTVQGNGVYFTCTSGTACSDSAMPLAQQITNPVASFATDNNGVIIQLPAASGTAASATGSLIFGIGTQGNNAVGTAKVFLLNGSGGLSTTYKGNSLNQSFIDSGSNAYFFPDSSIAACTTNVGFFCPSTTLNLSATIVGSNSASSAISFSVANADHMFSSSTVIAVAPDLAGPTQSSSGSTFNANATFDWGLPFYYGRSVYTAIEGQNTSAGMGPYFAF